MVYKKIPGLDFSPVQFVIGYAACYLESDKEQDCIIATGSDDGIKVWLNHKLIASHHVFRMCGKDDDKNKAHLKKGKNLLLLKVDQDYADYGFFLRILGPDEKPLVLKTANDVK